MAFKDFPRQAQGVQLLQRSLEHGRLGHAYLFSGPRLEQLESLAATLAKTLNCQQPARKGRAPVDCCDTCLSCQKIEHGNHADVHWVRPESKTRTITIEQVRSLMQEVNLKPAEAEYKVATIVAADRLNIQAGNAFLKTLEEPPARSILILITTEPQRLLETITSRCLRLSFGGEGPVELAPQQIAWLRTFGDLAASSQRSLLGRYRLADVLLTKLNEAKQAVEEALTARSPLQRYKDAEKDLIERWEEELKAAIEGEYRRQRFDLLLLLQWWLRDVWLSTLGKASGTRNETKGASLLSFPELPGTQALAQRLSPKEAAENLRIMDDLQRQLA